MCLPPFHDGVGERLGGEVGLGEAVSGLTLVFCRKPNVPSCGDEVRGVEGGSGGAGPASGAVLSEARLRFGA